LEEKREEGEEERGGTNSHVEKQLVKGKVVV